MKATYNITNDKLKAWFDERLSNEDYQSMRHAGFTFWHGSKCFAAKWSPTAEDLIRQLGIETIEEDDEPDNVEARVERYQKYAEGAEQAAASSEEYLAERANTDRRRNNAVNSIEKNLGAAEHWQARIEGAIRNAAYKERPDVIARRIRELEAHRRREVASYTPNPMVDGAKHGCPDSVWVGSRGRGGHWMPKGQLAGIEAHAKRWIEHIDRRLEYEHACLKAAGGCDEVLRPERKKAVQPKGKPTLKDGRQAQVGGAAGFDSGYSGKANRWYLILRVNRSTIDVVYTPDGFSKSYTAHRQEFYGVKDLKTPEQVKAEMPELYQHWVRVQEIMARNAERKARKEVQQEFQKEQEVA
jgi:hypothetical protein